MFKFIIVEFKFHFQGEDNDILCALGDICFSDTPQGENFQKVAKFYELNDELIEADHRLFTRI